MTENGTKIGYLRLLENLLINLNALIWSVVKVYINCSISIQIQYLGKIWFLGYGQYALSQSDGKISKSTTTYLERNDEVD